jgi:hypothetical protein
MSRVIVRQFFNIVALVATLVINGLSGAGLLNNQSPAEISNRLANLFVPANYVFSVWGVIYTLLIGFVVYQALPAQRTNKLIDRVGWWFVASCVANCVWIFLFHWNQFGWSVLAMLALLASLLTIYVRVGVGVTAARGGNFWWVQLPFSVYIGWITVATVANVAYALFDAGNTALLGIDGAIWATLMLVVAGGITLGLVWTRRDIGYALVIIWATVGVYVAQAATPLVAYTALGVAILVGVVLAARLLTGRGGAVRSLASA